MVEELQNRTIIFFSGGVESTALLSIAPPTSIAISVKIDNFNFMPNIYNIKKIIEQYKIPLEVITLDIKLQKEKWFHQLNILLTTSILLVNSYKNITNIWYGQNSIEPLSSNEYIFNKIHNDWKYMFPNIEFSAPLKSKSKREQWDLIPNKIKPLVSSCITNNNCKTCHKCMETPWRWL